MSIEAEVAGESVKYTLEGGAAVIKVAGSGFEWVAKGLMNILSEQKKTRGKARLETVLKRDNGQAICVAIKEEDWPKFKKYAKEYGILYSVAKDDEHPGTVAIVAPVSDSQKLKFMFQRNDINQLDQTQLEAIINGTPASEREQEKQQPQSEQSQPHKTEKSEQRNEAEIGVQQKSAEELATEEVFKQPIEAEKSQPENPTAARMTPTAKRNQFEQSSKDGVTVSESLMVSMDSPTADSRGNKKESVREKLKQNAETIKANKVEASRDTERHTSNQSRASAKSKAQKEK